MNASMLTRIKRGPVRLLPGAGKRTVAQPFIMSRMALVASEGGAVAIRANSLVDVQAIMNTVDLPIIGIIKRPYPASDVYITPTLQEVDELMAAQPHMIALDATLHTRPGKRQLPELIMALRQHYPHLLLMADIAAPEEARNAAELGFDCISTTLCDYTLGESGSISGR